MWVWLDEDTRKKLEDLYQRVQAMRAYHTEMVRLGKSNFLSPLVTMSDEEYDHWKVVQHEMSALYSEGRHGEADGGEVASGLRAG